MAISARESRAATLVAYLQRLQEAHQADFQLKSSLTVHLLGADHREGDTGAETLEVFKSFSLYLATQTSLSSLKLVLVGPNLSRKLHLRQFSHSYSRGAELGANKCQVDVSYFVSGFEAYFDEKELYCVPDLVVCFNAGIWGYDEWLPAIRLVLDEVRVPLLITSYNEREASDDEDELDELNPAKWLWRPEKNPHGACTPRATNNEDGSILKENDYWMCLTGRPQ